MNLYTMLRAVSTSYYCTWLTCLITVSQTGRMMTVSMCYCAVYAPYTRSGPLRLLPCPQASHSNEATLSMQPVSFKGKQTCLLAEYERGKRRCIE